MLQLVTQKQLILRPKLDHTLTGHIKLSNSSEKCYIAYKIKSTNPSLFLVQPTRGFIIPKKQQLIQVTTVDIGTPQLAKDLSHHHKFLIEYFELTHKPANVEQALKWVQGPAVQKLKIYINTDSIRSSRIHGQNRQHSIRSSKSNKYQFQSVCQTPIKNLKTQRNVTNSNGEDVLDKAKHEVEVLERERSSLISQTTHKKSPLNIKLFTIIFVVSLILGNFLSRFMGLSEYLSGNQDSQQQASWWGFGSSQQQSHWF